MKAWLQVVFDGEKEYVMVQELVDHNASFYLQYI